MAVYEQISKVSPSALRRKADLYFTKCDAEFISYTLSGLCVYLEISTSTLSRYGKRPEYKKAITHIRGTIETHIITNALNNTYNSGFSQFILKTMNRDKYVVAEKSKVETKTSSVVQVSPIFKVLEQIKQSRGQVIAIKVTENQPLEDDDDE